VTTLDVSVHRAGQADVPTLAWLRRAWSEEDGLPDDLDFNQRFANWLDHEGDTRRLYAISAVWLDLGE